MIRSNSSLKTIMALVWASSGTLTEDHVILYCLGGASGAGPSGAGASCLAPAKAKVATSAEEARQFGMLGPEDRVVINRDYLMAEAKREVLHMLAGNYRPPLPEKIYAVGRDGLAALRLGIHSFREGNYITEYEAVIGEVPGMWIGDEAGKLGRFVDAAAGHREKLDLLPGAVELALVGAMRLRPEQEE